MDSGSEPSRLCYIRRPLYERMRLVSQGHAVTSCYYAASASVHAAGDYSDLVAAGRQRVLQTFKESGVGDIEGCITHELVITPDQWAQRYGLRHGAAFGLAHGLDQLSVFR